MSNRALLQAAPVLIETGRKVGENLAIDPRMVQASMALDRIQDALKARFRTWETAVAEEHRTRAQRDRFHQQMVGETRELAFMILCVTHNHHNVDLYLRYFPDGYGVILQLKAEEVADFVHGILTTLEDETNPRLLPYKEKLETSLAAYVAAQAEYGEAVRNRKEAFTQLRNAKRDWGRGMSLVRALADACCHYDRPYIRSIFAPMRPQPRLAEEEAKEEPEVAETPATGRPPVPLVAPVAMVPGSVPVPTKEEAA